MRTEDVILYKSTHLTRVENQLLDFLVIALLVLCQLARRCDAVDPQLQEQVRSLSIEQLESLGEMLLDFSTVEDVVTWLNQLEQSAKSAIMILVEVKFCKVF